MVEKQLWANWKTVDNVEDYYTESDDPILKEDPYHKEIIDITTGLVVEFKPVDYYEEFTDNQPLIRDDVGDVFCSTDWSKH